MITATEARTLAGPSPQERVDMLEIDIKQAALERKRSINLHDDFWVREGYSGSKDYKQAVMLLEGLGYKVSFYYKEHSIAVDMYTIVEW
jgi:hypothetical protein